MILVKVQNRHIKNIISKNFKPDQVTLVKDGEFMKKKRPDDIFHYVYICRGNCNKTTDFVNRPYLVNCVYDEDSDRFFYPDMILRNNLLETAVVTRASDPLPGPETPAFFKENADIIYDAECAYAYNELSKKYRSHEFSILVYPIKSPYDAFASADGTYFTEEFERDIIEYLSLLICVEAISTIEKIKEDTNELIIPVTSHYYGKLENDLKCSETMKHEFKELMKYWNLKKLPIRNIFVSLYQKGLMPVSSKKEGLLLINELKRELL